MTIGDLIDFHLAIKAPGQLIGFDTLYGDELDTLKQKIQEIYGTQEAWLERSEKEELPEEIARMADDLVGKYKEWMS